MNAQANDNLVSKIEATLPQQYDLRELIRQNDFTNTWTDEGLHTAKRCVTDCEKSITEARKLLKKSTASTTLDEENRDEFDFIKFERALWLLIKARLEVD
ncbi:MAG: hypothetical protein Q9219_004398 [cf. Caloplaca sp. 3 TL-2023]